MPHYTGSANSFADLRTALFNACVTEGYTLATDILTKGTLAVRIINNTVATSTNDVGLQIQGGTGVSGGALVNPSGARPRMGRIHTSVNQPTWPMEYNIHIHTNPDEVYMTARYNVDSFLWLAFGLSDTPGLGATGCFVAAITGLAQCNSTGGGIVISATDGAIFTGNTTAAGIFWQSYQGTHILYLATVAHTVASGLDSRVWGGDPGTTGANIENNISGVLTARTLIGVLPNAWNQESPLVPINVWQFRPSTKLSQIADLKHARYVRIDNYEPGQIITIGSDRWKIYPFYKKNSAARNGGSQIDHTGTFGWAIRYDGS